MNTKDVRTIAAVVHETMRAYRREIGEEKIPSWTWAPRWMRESTMEGVRFRIANPDAPPEAQHQQWMAEKEAKGWRRGDKKDERAKTHPSLIPYDQLPEIDRRKDALFASVVRALTAPL